MKSLLFTAILSLRKRSEQILIKFAIPLQVRLTHAQTFFRGVGLDKPGQEKNYEMCESRTEIKQDDIEVF
jgi:hypothetical protein